MKDADKAKLDAFMTAARQYFPHAAGGELAEIEAFILGYVEKHGWPNDIQFKRAAAADAEHKRLTITVHE